MSNLVNALIKSTSLTYTENGSLTLDTSAGNLVDFFFTAGALRSAEEDRIIDKFRKAVSEDRQLGVAIALWARDVRGGAGERRLFRVILDHLVRDDSMQDVAKAMMKKIPQLGRWDDLLVVFNATPKGGTPVHVSNKLFAVELIRNALNRGDGLCAKWMPRKGETAAALRADLGMTPKTYRKTLVNLTDVVESKMCDKEWDKITYEHIPSQASARYAQAFRRHDESRYEDYLQSVMKGETKMNAGAVYPYDVLRTLQSGNASAADAQWASLPNFMENVRKNKLLPLIDTSGSMWSPISPRSSVSCEDVAVSLGLYISERNEGMFKDVFMTFSSSPKLQVVKGKTLGARVRSLSSAHWEFSTNLDQAFETILDAAKQNGLSEDDMPEYIIVVSDMEFDLATGPNSNKTTFERIDKMYENAGYVRPNIVWWNVQSRQDNVPVQYDETGTALVSGCSPEILKAILGDIECLTPEAVMMNAIAKERYLVDV